MQDSQIIRTEYSELMKKSYIDYAMINHIENVPVSLGIRWENITRTVTVLSMMH